MKNFGGRRGGGGDLPSSASDDPTTTPPKETSVGVSCRIAALETRTPERVIGCAGLNPVTPLFVRIVRATETGPI